MSDIGQAVGGLNLRLDKLDGRFEKLEESVADMRGRIRAMPDLRLPGHNVRHRLGRQAETREGLTHMKVAINDVNASLADTHEINALREEVHALRLADMDREARLRVLDEALAPGA